MGILSKLFDRQTETEDAQAAVHHEEVQADCPHTILLPRWDSVNDMGDENKAVEFSCESCRLVFTPTEAKVQRSARSMPLS